MLPDPVTSPLSINSKNTGNMDKYFYVQHNFIHNKKLRMGDYRNYNVFTQWNNIQSPNVAKKYIDKKCL